MTLSTADAAGQGVRQLITIERFRGIGPCVRREDGGFYFPCRTGAEICSVRSRSVMSTTVAIGAVSS